ncbi:MAG: carboxypeptidase-like regulatory domain-containing protein [Bacteroidia bacterium]
MKPTLRIEIPEPCNVPWNSMAEVANGKRHCGSCDKVLTDFSQWSDEQLIHYFTRNKGKLCGRFSGEQLNRNITAPEIKQRFWPRLLVPAFLISATVSAQQTTPKKVTTVQKKTQQKKLSITISGIVSATDSLTCPGATISITNGADTVTAMSDAKGHFTALVLAAENDTLHAVVSLSGFEKYKTDVVVVKNQSNYVLNVSMMESIETLEEKEQFPVIKELPYVGGVCIKTVAIEDTKALKRRRFFRKLFHPFSR